MEKSTGKIGAFFGSIGRFFRGFGEAVAKGDLFVKLSLIWMGPAISDVNNISNPSSLQFLRRWSSCSVSYAQHSTSRNSLHWEP